MQLTDEIAGELKRLEEALLSPDVRRSRARLDALLADDFVEYGASGRIYDKPAILGMTGKAYDGQLSLHAFSAMALAPTVALVRYRSLLRRADGRESHALRCSVWSSTEQGWKLVFHQGTPTFPEDRQD
jgi:hypothetical protein